MRTGQARVAQGEVQGQWKSYTRNRDQPTRDFLIEHYLYLVRSVAERMHAKLVGQVEVDDLTSSGTLGLMGAIKSFDPRRGVKFETYCVPRIRGAMLDELRSMDWVPRLARSRHRRLVEAVQTLEAATGRKPTDAEIAAGLHVSLGEARHIQSDSHIAGLVSLEHPVYGECDKECRVGDVLPGRAEEDPARQSLRRDLVEMTQRGLSRAERLVLLLYYCEGMTMRDIGATLGLSESRVSQMHSALLARMRARLEAQGAFEPVAA